MWKLSESILGDNEEQQDNLFGEQEGLCSLSPLQVLHFIHYFPQNFTALVQDPYFFFLKAQIDLS